jgi:hypothetical protein
MSGYFVADTTALAAVVTTGGPKLRWVDSLKAQFFFVAAASETAQADNIVTATDAGGQWFRQTYILIDTDPQTLGMKPLFVGQNCETFQASSGGASYIGRYIATSLSAASASWSGPYQ